MLNCKRYTIFMVMMSFGCATQAMNLGHINDTHIRDKNVTLHKDIVKNYDNGVWSVVNEAGERKTLFPESMTKESIERQLRNIYNNGRVLAQTDTIQYKKDPYSELIVGMAKDASGRFSTAFPVLRYIPLSETEGIDKDTLIYIAHKKSNEDHSLTKIANKISKIEQMAELSTTDVAWNAAQSIVVKDIGFYYANVLFSGVGSKRGSILVESRMAVAPAMENNLIEENAQNPIAQRMINDEGFITVTGSKRSRTV